MIKGNTTEQGNQFWNNIEILKLMGCVLGGKGQSRILYHGGRGKVHEYFQGAVKNSLAIFKVKELVETEASKNFCLS